MVDTANYFESDSPYEKAANFRDHNEVCKITKAGNDTLQNRDGDDRNVIWIKLDGLDKPIVLSNTNGRVLRNAFGRQTAKWIGCEVLLTTKDYTFDGASTVGWITNPMPAAGPGADDDDFNDDLP